MSGGNELTSLQAERLKLLLDNLMEAQKAVVQVLLDGYEGESSGDGMPNRRSLERSLGETASVLQLMCTAGDLDDEVISIAEQLYTANLGDRVTSQ